MGFSWCNEIKASCGLNGHPYCGSVVDIGGYKKMNQESNPAHNSSPFFSSSELSVELQQPKCWDMFHIQPWTMKPCLFYNSQLEYFGNKTNLRFRILDLKNIRKQFLWFFCTWFLVAPKFWIISTLHMVSNYCLAHLITLSDVDQASI